MLPQSLVYLKIFNNLGNNQLNNLPNKLIFLDVGTCLCSMNNLPNSIEELRIDNGNKLPQNIKKIKIQSSQSSIIKQIIKKSKFKCDNLL